MIGPLGGTVQRPEPRRITWLVHVSRMDYSKRLPRKMLSSWIPSKRPNGAPAMTYGRSICRALDQFNIDREIWPQMWQRMGWYLSTPGVYMRGVKKEL